MGQLHNCGELTLSQNFDWMRLENEWAWEKGCLPSNLLLLLKRTPELLILNWFSSFKSFNDISSYYRWVLPMILLMYPFENLHAYSFFASLKLPLNFPLKLHLTTLSVISCSNRSSSINGMHRVPSDCFKIHRSLPLKVQLNNISHS